MGEGIKKKAKTGHNLLITDTEQWVHEDSVYFSVYTFIDVQFP